MINKLCLLLLLLLPAFGLGQFVDDSLYQKAFDDDCGGRIFSRVEVLPTLKIKKEAFEDTIYSYLKSRNVIIQNKSAYFIFLVTTKSQVFSMRKEFGYVPNESIIMEALSSLSAVWLPGTQNARNVCAVVRIKITFLTDRLLIDIK